MFYVRTKLHDDVSIEVDVTRENVFNRCPFCGKEVQVDLTEFAGDENFDLIESGVLCEDCTRNQLEA